MKRLLCTILFVLAASSQAAADFNTGLAAYNSDDFETAMKEWTPLAEEGTSTLNTLSVKCMFTERHGPEFRGGHSLAEQGRVRAATPTRRLFWAVSMRQLRRGAEF